MGIYITILSKKVCQKINIEFFGKQKWMFRKSRKNNLSRYSFTLEHIDWSAFFILEKI